MPLMSAVLNLSTGEILRCFENTPERGHPARLWRRNPTHAAGRMPALQGISWFLGARQRTGMSDCHENGSPPPKEEGAGGGGPTINHPWPLLSKEGNHGVIFMHSGERKDHGICAEDDSEGLGMTVRADFSTCLGTCRTSGGTAALGRP